MRRKPHRRNSHYPVHRALFAAVLLFVSDPAAQGECLPPYVRDPAFQADGHVLIRWAHPCSFADTISVYPNGFQHRFCVSLSGSGHRIAFRLPPPSPGQLLFSIRAFFSAQDEVTAADWANRARFCWALHADQSGLPGPPVSSLITWPLGDYTELRGGGWFSGRVEWWLPDSVPAGHWLVGSWPEEALGVVAIGSEAAQPLLSSLAGRDGDGGTNWTQLFYQALLTEIVVLGSEVPSTGDETEGTAFPLYAPSFLIIRELTAGPFSPSTDTITLPEDTGLSWVDTLAKARQILRYGVVTLCDTGISAPAWTEPIEIAEDVTTAIIPESADPTDATVHRRNGWELVPHLNPFGDELVVRLVPVQALTPRGPSTSAFQAVELPREVSYAIFDIVGRRCREGRTEVMMSTTDAATIRITGTGSWASGVYFCRVRLGSQVLSVKMLHIK